MCVNADTDIDIAQEGNYKRKNIQRQRVWVTKWEYTQRVCDRKECKITTNEESKCESMRARARALCRREDIDLWGVICVAKNPQLYNDQVP